MGLLLVCTARRWANARSNAMLRSVLQPNFRATKVGL